MVSKYSLVSFLFAVLLLTVPFVKVGDVPPCPMESAPLYRPYNANDVKRFLLFDSESYAPVTRLPSHARWNYMTVIVLIIY